MRSWASANDMPRRMAHLEGEAAAKPSTVPGLRPAGQPSVGQRKRRKRPQNLLVCPLARMCTPVQGCLWETERGWPRVKMWARCIDATDATPRHYHLVDLACIQAEGPASRFWCAMWTTGRAAQGVSGIRWKTAWRLAWAPRAHVTCIA